MQAGSENQLIVIIKGHELCIEQNNYISRTTSGNYFQNWPHMFSCYQSNLSERWLNS